MKRNSRRLEPRTLEPEDVDSEINRQLIVYYSEKLGVTLSQEDATFIMVHHFDSFCATYVQHRKCFSDQSKASLIAIAKLAQAGCVHSLGNVAFRPGDKI